ncbi:hypothetical protein GWM83_04135 [Candidatus Bathyarchaeota archaeon]|nr:hypothetical protein [Candidatus Bathyarchaeota archaeon]NIW34731.1 hypothetical protein [Candidatus Bathyarchaeota archaeon]
MDGLAGKRRGRIEIMMDILDRASKGMNKTDIGYGANLNLNMVNGYLPLLMKRGLIVRVDGETGDIFRITQKGRKVLKNYREIEKIT